MWEMTKLSQCFVAGYKDCVVLKINNKIKINIIIKLIIRLTRK